jgi:NTP pyrophosphatase (non-canonical NTP hydrolase)
MNIKDIRKAMESGDIPPAPEGDFLTLMFERQKELMEKYEPIESGRGARTVKPEDWGKIDHRFVQWRIKDLSQRVVEELMESMNTLRNKPWKQSEVETDVDHFQEELADTMHFFIELLITAGISAEDFFLLYYMKSEVNKFRQRSNY